MKRTLLAALTGIVIGAGIAVFVIDLSGGWWEYSILGESACKTQRGLGTAHVAPNQPNPCLIRVARFGIISR